jgi:diacylglycerol kinase (ATP)
MPTRALLLINNKSRSGSADVHEGIDRLRNRGIDVVETKPEHCGQFPDLIRKYRDHVDCVIVGGGDGSMNAAAAALVETGLPLGVLPMGTANDLARTLNIPVDIEQAFDIIADGIIHRIDLGCINGRYFFNVANIGLGVRVKRYLSADLKRRWGVFSYAHSLIKAIRSFQPFHAEITCDGRHRRVRTIQIAVGNGRYYGGGMTVAEQASIDDDQFFLYSLDPLSLWEMLKFAPAFRTGRFENQSPVYLDQGRTIEISTRKPMPVTADGELITSTPAKFSMQSRAIAVFVPTDYFKNKEESLHAAQKRSATCTESS